MAKTATGGKVQYDEVVKRLEAIVESLEGGELSLEDSLERFAEGINLVKQGEGLLTDAEKRIEQLLSEDGRTAPIEVKELPAAPSTAATRAPAPPAPPKKLAPPADDDDVPF
ncbi:MAG: exodeoxyribonuclease VII small subunit [Myxococcales bacterium]|nr:exodeoxyribonuclease VII small subunit [Myxococcales bacterium]